MPETKGILAQLESLSIENSTSIPFRPTSSREWRHLQLAPIPRFLFRVFTPKSDGSTNDTCVEDVFQRSDSLSRTYELCAHLRWYRKPRNDNLVSWTSSLLFAIQYMFYRHLIPEDSSSLDEIRLCIVDTTEIGAASFIRDLDLISAFATGNQYLEKFEALRTAGTHYYGEYLSQGALKIQGNCKIVSAKAMLDCGLGSLWPEFSSRHQGENEWAKKVVQIRERLVDSEHKPHDISADQKHVALAISELFGPTWRMPMAVNLLALLPGH